MRHLAGWTQACFNQVTIAGDLDGSFLDLEFVPFQPISLQDDARQRVTLRLAGAGVERYHYPTSLSFGGPFISQIAGEPVLCSGEAGVPCVPFIHLYRHVEF